MVGIQQLHSAPRTPVLHSPLPLATPSPLNNEAPRGIKKLVRCSQWFFKKTEPDMVAHLCNFSTWEVKAGDQGSRPRRQGDRIRRGWSQEFVPEAPMTIVELGRH